LYIKNKACKPLLLIEKKYMEVLKMIREISIKSHKRELGGSYDNHKLYRTKLQKIIQSTLMSLETDEIRLYDIEGEFHNYNAGNRNSVVILVNGTETRTGNPITLPSPLNIAGIQTDITTVLPPRNTEDCIQIKEGDLVIAEWVNSTYTLNILFNLFATYDIKYCNIFEHIMKKFEELVWSEKLKEFSWKFTSSKQSLTANFTSKLKDVKSREINTLRQDIKGIESNIEDYKKRIKSNTDNLGLKRRTLENEIKNLENVSTALISDFDLIAQHEKVKDFQVIDGILHIHTVPIYIYSDKGRKYYGGNYKITIDMENTDVRFYGDNPRESYWSKKDPHPHVNGNSGQACLGNTSSTIAELCSQMQAYALTMICIDFLEAANTADSAGKNVINWEEIKEEKAEKAPGTVSSRRTCPCCGNEFDESELLRVYDNVHSNDDDELYVLEEDINHVCEDCRESNYYYEDEVAEYVAD
jgi:hypothetical protein